MRAWTGTPATPGTAVDTVVDNAAATNHALGAWTSSTYLPGYYGSDYVSDGNTAKGAKNFRFKPSLAANAKYNVYACWPTDPNRATNVPIDIVTASGTVATVTVNQTLNNNVWVLLGTYPLSAANAEVILRTDGTSGYVIADAVRFTPVP